MVQGKGLSMNNVCTLARAPGGQMRGASPQAMPVCIVEERQQSRCPSAAAPLRAAARRPAAKCKRYSLTGPNWSCGLRQLKIDISALHIRAGQLHVEPVTDIQALKTAHQPSFSGRLQKTDPRTLVGCAGDESIKSFPDP